jgi:hypothetical protein
LFGELRWYVESEALHTCVPGYKPKTEVMLAWGHEQGLLVIEMEAAALPLNKWNSSGARRILRSDACLAAAVSKRDHRVLGFPLPLCVWFSRCRAPSSFCSNRYW